MELEVPVEVLAALREAFGEDSSEDLGEPLTEAVATKRLTGHIVLRGFSDSVVGSVPGELKVRIQAAKVGSRVRVIFDLQV